MPVLLAATTCHVGRVGTNFVYAERTEALEMRRPICTAVINARFIANLDVNAAVIVREGD